MEILFYAFHFLFERICFYPLGLFQLWVRERQHKSLYQTIETYTVEQVIKQGRMVMLNIIAATGTIVLTALLILMICVTIWSVFKAATS